MVKSFTVLPALCSSRMERRVSRRIEALKPPAKPRSEVATTRRCTAADLCEARHLLLAHLAVVDVEDVDLLGAFGAVFIDADDHFLAAVDARLAPRRRFLDLELGHAALDRLGHAAERLDFLDELPRRGGHRMRQALDVVAAAQRVDDMGNAALLGEDELGIAG